MGNQNGGIPCRTAIGRNCMEEGDTVTETQPQKLLSTKIVAKLENRVSWQMGKKITVANLVITHEQNRKKVEQL